MANARIYYKWSNQTAWSGPVGGGGHAGTKGSITASRGHAERVAWEGARTQVLAAARQGIGNNQIFQVKIWVDQQICPQCQKWMVIDVLSQLKVLPMRHELWVEVVFAGVTRSMKVQRTASWPREIGGVAQFSEMPADYYS